MLSPSKSHASEQAATKQSNTSFRLTRGLMGALDFAVNTAHQLQAHYKQVSFPDHYFPRAGMPQSYQRTLPPTRLTNLPEPVKPDQNAPETTQALSRCPRTLPITQVGRELQQIPK